MEDEEIESTEETVAEEVVAETEEAAVEEVEETEETEEVAEVEEPEKKAALPKGVQKRIDKITRQKYDAERQIQDLQHQLANRPEAQPANVEKPTLEQFDFDDSKYIEALTDWKVGEAMKARGQDNAAQQQQAHENEVLQDFEARRQKTVLAGVTKYEDFEEKIRSPGVVYTPVMTDIMGDSDIGHEIAYYLADNIEESRRIGGLSPTKQASEITKLEAQLASKPTNKLTKATKPVKPVGGKGATTHKLDPVKDWAKWSEERNKAGL